MISFPNLQVKISIPPFYIFFITIYYFSKTSDFAPTKPDAYKISILTNPQSIQALYAYSPSWRWCMTSIRQPVQSFCSTEYATQIRRFVYNTPISVPSFRVLDGVLGNQSECRYPSNQPNIHSLAYRYQVSLLICIIIYISFIFLHSQYFVS